MNLNKLAAKARFTRPKRRMREVEMEIGKTPGGPAYKAGNQLIRTVRNRILLRGLFDAMEHWRDGVMISRHVLANDVTNEGLNKLAGLGYFTDAKITTWYILIIDQVGFTALADADTYNAINQAGNGWDEFTDYTDGNNADSATTRPIWTTTVPSGQSVSNTVTQSIYNVTATASIRGVGVVGGTNVEAELKDDFTLGNTLTSTAEFSGAPVAISNGDQLKITYTLNFAHP